MGNWLNITKTSGTSGTTNVSVGAVANEYNYDRILVRKVSTDFADKDVIFIQRANPIDNSQSVNSDIGKYLTFEMLEDGSLGWYSQGYQTMGDVYYRINGGAWIQVAKSGETNFNVNASDIVEWIGNCLKTSYYPTTYGTEQNHFKANYRCKVYGNVMSLFYGEAVTESYDNEFPLIPARATSPAIISVDHQLWGLFKDCVGITDASRLVLPAMKLTPYCYASMFNGCSSLTTAPILPALTLVEGCYEYMFNDCSSLSYIECYATDISETDCTKNWVSGVSSSGTFIKEYGITWPTGNNGIPSGWDVIE